MITLGEALSRHDKMGIFLEGAQVDNDERSIHGVWPIARRAAKSATSAGVRR
jgi:hypothetical protein